MSEVNSPVDIVGVTVEPWHADAFIAAMITSARREPGARSGWFTTVHYANAHVLNTAYSHPALRDELNRASTVYCDGAGVQLAARVLGRSLPAKLTSADLIDDLCQAAAAADVPLFLLGGTAGVAARAAHILGERHPNLVVAGTHHGFLDRELTETVIAEINSTRAGILLVGMGTPLQELWIARYRDHIHTPVVWSVGALFDFVAGVERRAPASLHTRGLEWAWRWARDPRRLSRRYLIGLPLFGLRVLSQRLQGLSSE